MNCVRTEYRSTVTHVRHTFHRFSTHFVGVFHSAGFRGDGDDFPRAWAGIRLNVNFVLPRRVGDESDVPAVGREARRALVERRRQKRYGCAVPSIGSIQMSRELASGTT